MKELIACCGLDCGQCEARIATVADDQTMREMVAEKWRTLYNAPGITAASINCTGCRMAGAKFAHCETTCEIRKCVKTKGYDSCADCPEMELCKIVGEIFSIIPEARNNLIQLRN